MTAPVAGAVLRLQKLTPRVQPALRSIVFTPARDFVFRSRLQHIHPLRQGTGEDSFDRCVFDPANNETITYETYLKFKFTIILGSVMV